jgi:hypothetical protein
LTAPIVITGDSHTICCLQAVIDMGLTDRIKGSRLGGGGLYQEQFFRWRDGKLLPGSLVVEKALARQGVMDLAACRGRLAVSLGLGAAPFYKQFAGMAFGSAADGLIRHVSQQVIDTMIADMQRHIMEFLDICFANGLLLAAIAGPRPQRRHRAAERHGSRLLELVAMYEAPVRKALAEAGCRIIEPPEAVDAGGFLKEEYWGSDPSHANAAYGRLVVTRLLQIREGIRPA